MWLVSDPTFCEHSVADDEKREKHERAQPHAPHAEAQQELGQEQPQHHAIDSMLDHLGGSAGAWVSSRPNGSAGRQWNCVQQKNSDCSSVQVTKEQGRCSLCCKTARFRRADYFPADRTMLENTTLFRCGKENDRPSMTLFVVFVTLSPRRESRNNGKKLLLKWQWNTWTNCTTYKRGEAPKMQQNVKWVTECRVHLPWQKYLQSDAGRANPNIVPQTW